MAKFKSLSEYRDALKKEAQKITDIPDNKTVSEQEDYVIAKEQALVESIKQDREERKKYAFLIYCLIVAWLALIIVIVILAGFGIVELSDAVLITLITTTTANIAAFFLGVIRYLFPNKVS